MNNSQTAGTEWTLTGFPYSFTYEERKKGVFHTIHLKLAPQNCGIINKRVWTFSRFETDLKYTKFHVIRDVSFWQRTRIQNIVEVKSVNRLQWKRCVHQYMFEWLYRARECWWISIFSIKSPKMKVEKCKCLFLWCHYGKVCPSVDNDVLHAWTLPLLCCVCNRDVEVEIENQCV